MHINHVILQGNILSLSAVQKYDKKSGGKGEFAYVKLGLSKKDERKNTANLMIFDGLIDVFEKFLNVGSNIIVEGRFSSSDEKDEDGNYSHRSCIIVERFHFGNKTKKETILDRIENNLPVSKKEQEYIAEKAEEVKASKGKKSSEKGLVIRDETSPF
jgi:single-stranded DNA-binding protein